MTTPTSTATPRPGLALGKRDPGRNRRSGPAVTVGSVLAVLAGALLFLGGLMVIAAIVMSVVVITLCVAAVGRVSHGLHPGGSRGVDRRATHPSASIDATATVHPVTAPEHGA